MTHNDENSGDWHNPSNCSSISAGDCASSVDSSSTSTSLLGRLRHFLPRIAASNAALVEAAVVNNGGGSGSTAATETSGCEGRHRGDGDEAVTVHLIDSDDDDDEDDFDDAIEDENGEKDVDDGQEMGADEVSLSATETDEPVSGVVEDEMTANEGKENGVEGFAHKLSQPKQFVQFDVLLCKTDSSTDGEDYDGGDGEQQQAGVEEPLSKKKYLVVDTESDQLSSKIV
uniref:Uncharacterized protein n=1 Tax=Globodera pallida TaxID=36090 RepID=A0A183BSU2_GLOPA